MGEIYSVPYNDVTEAGSHFLRNMVLASRNAVSRDGKDSTRYDFALGFGGRIEL
jgi:hypothetical protein